MEDDESATSPTQPYRTAFHFQPPKHWMSGPMLYKGIYHLFYQYCPQGAVADWANMIWGHSTSLDLVNWISHEPAIYPSQDADIKGTWSGSATLLPDGTPVILYTGVNSLGHQVQNMAMPKDPVDPNLTEWVKSHTNPLIAPSPLNQIDASWFRDPTTAWLGVDGRWRVIIGSKINNEGLAILYTSEDLVKWVKAKQPMHSAPDTGMWECPDFYPVLIDKQNGVDMEVGEDGVKYVLKVSLNDARHDHYTIGDYDCVNDIYTPNQGSTDGDLGLRYDYGKFYASKSFYDSAKKRRILWGWLGESSSVADNIKKGWAGIQGIPRVILLDKSGRQLVQWPIEEIEMLRFNPVWLAGKVLRQGKSIHISGVTAAQADVEISFKVSNIEKAEVLNCDEDPQMLSGLQGASVQGNVGPFGLHVFASQGMKECTSIFFGVFKLYSNYVVLMCCDQNRFFRILIN